MDNDYAEWLDLLAKNSSSADEIAECVYADVARRPTFKELSDERVFLENLVQTRFNFFIVTYGIVLVYGLSSADLKRCVVILVVGAIVLAALALAIYRIHIKLDFTLKLLHHYRSSVSVTQAGIRPYPFSSVSATDIIGFYVPIYGSATLLILAFSTFLQMTIEGHNCC
jgi:hypothetical protein